MAKGRCGSCPENKCRNCPVRPLTDEEIEDLAIKSALNHGAPESMAIPDPDTGEYVWVEMRNPSPEAIAVLKKIYKDKK